MLSVDLSKIIDEIVHYYPEKALLKDMICVDGFVKALALKFVLCEDVDKFLLVS